MVYQSEMSDRDSKHSIRIQQESNVFNQYKKISTPASRNINPPYPAEYSMRHYASGAHNASKKTLSGAQFHSMSYCLSSSHRYYAWVACCFLFTNLFTYLHPWLHKYNLLLYLSLFLLWTFFISTWLWLELCRTAEVDSGSLHRHLTMDVQVNIPRDLYRCQV